MSQPLSYRELKAKLDSIPEKELDQSITVSYDGEALFVFQISLHKDMKEEFSCLEPESLVLDSDYPQ